MLKISDIAKTKIKEAIENYKKPVVGIRALAQARSPFQVSYGLAFVDEKNIHENDKILKIDISPGFPKNIKGQLLRKS